MFGTDGLAAKKQPNPDLPEITKINADTENECFVCVDLRILRTRAFPLVPCVLQKKSSRWRFGCRVLN